MRFNGRQKRSAGTAFPIRFLEDAGCRINPQGECPAGWVIGVMRLRDVLDNDRLLLVVCHDCNGKTPLDPAYFALRLGLDHAVEDIAPEIHCPVCGSADITLGAHSPIERREINVSAARP